MSPGVQEAAIILMCVYTHTHILSIYHAGQCRSKSEQKQVIHLSSLAFVELTPGRKAYVNQITTKMCYIITVVNVLEREVQVL